jgi:hypothetical protein
VDRGVKLLFDENFGKPIVSALADLAGFSRAHCRVKHLLERFQPGTPDEEWIPKIAQEGFILISSDLGRGKRGRRLPEICIQCGLTHVLVSGKLHNQTQFEKIRGVLVVWPRLLETAQEPPGTGYMLKMSSGGNPVLEKRPSRA